MEFILMLVVGIGMGVACAAIANRKGRRGGLWFLLGFLFSLISLIVILVLPKKN